LRSTAFFGPYVAAFFFLVPLIGMTILGVGVTGILAFFTAAVVLVVSLGNYRYPPTTDFRAPAPQD